MRNARENTICLTVVDEAGARMLTSLHRPGGAVAQLGARLDGIEEVVGSNPIGSTKFATHEQSPLLLLRRQYNLWLS
jgi:hypothetical protein